MAVRIGKTRLAPEPPEKRTAETEEVFDPEVGQARGMIRRPLPAGKMRHARRSPADDLAEWIAHYWMIRWDLRGCEPHLAESLPHPNVHVIFEPSGTVIAGVQTRMFTRLLDGQSQVFGVKFKPGGFRPFLKSAVSTIADLTVPPERILGNVGGLAEIVLSSCAEEQKVGAANDFFRARLPKHDPTVSLAGELVNRILEDRSVKTVDDLVRIAGMGKRSLQRVFREYVGASPKWVIRRYRLHELIERSNCAEGPEWSQLALDLGYFDQAHLINDFRTITGYSPTEYLQVIRKGKSG